MKRDEAQMPYAYCVVVDGCMVDTAYDITKGKVSANNSKRARSSKIQMSTLLLTLGGLFLNVGGCYL